MLFEVASHLQIISSLFHDYIETRHLFLAEVDTRLRHIILESLVENLHVSGSISLYSLDKSMVTVRTKIKILVRKISEILAQKSMPYLKSSIKIAN